MPLKDKEAYNEYMKNYMRKKGSKVQSKRKTERKAKERDKIEESDMDMTTLDLEKGRQMLGAVSEKTKDKDTGEIDPVFKTLDKVMKYAPTAIELLKGFADAAKSFSPPQPQVQQQMQQPSIMPPDRWEAMTPVQRVGRQFTHPDWYAQGLAWEQYKKTGMVQAPQPQVQQQAYSPPPQAPPQRQAEPRNLSELESKYPEPPLVDDGEPSEGHIPIEELKRKVDSNQDDKQEDKIQDDKNKGEEQMTEREKALVERLQQDNVKYLSLMSDYVNGLSDEEFKRYLGDIDGLKKMFKSKAMLLNMLLPVHTKQMLAEMSPDDFLRFFEESCPDKMNLVKPKKKLDEVKEVLKELQEMLK